MLKKVISLPPLHCYRDFPSTRGVYLAKSHYETLSSQMILMDQIWGPGSWTTLLLSLSALPAIGKFCFFCKFPTIQPIVLCIFGSMFSRFRFSLQHSHCIFAENAIFLVRFSHQHVYSDNCSCLSFLA